MENEYINDDLIDDFLFKLYEKCGNSIFNMEELMKDFVYSGKGLYIDECDMVYDFKDQIYDLKRDIKWYQDENKKLKIEIKDEKKCNSNCLKRIIELEKYIKELKNESVIFSMDFEDKI